MEPTHARTGPRRSRRPCTRRVRDRVVEMWRVQCKLPPRVVDALHTGTRREPNATREIRRRQAHGTKQTLHGRDLGPLTMPFPPLNFPSTGETHTRGGLDANASTAWISSARKVRIPPLLPVQPRISESLGTFSTKRLIQNPPSPSLTSLLPNSNPTGTRVVHTR